MFEVSSFIKKIYSYDIWFKENQKFGKQYFTNSYCERHPTLCFRNGKFRFMAPFYQTCQPSEIKSVMMYLGHHQSACRSPLLDVSPLQ